MRAAWALVDQAPLAAAITPTDEELAKYREEHAAEFRLPERRRVQYVAFNPKDFVPTVTAAEIDKYYEEHAKEFETPLQARAAHILISVPEGAGGEAEAKAKAAAADVLRRAKAGEDFAKLARELSQDPGSAGSGGDLGYVSKGEMVPQFEDALFKLKKGEISPEPVRTPFGFHVIKVTDVREGRQEAQGGGGRRDPDATGLRGRPARGEGQGRGGRAPRCSRPRTSWPRPRSRV